MPFKNKALTFIFSLLLSLAFNFSIFVLFKKAFGLNFLIEARAGVWLITSFIFFILVFYFAIPLTTSFLKEFFENKKTKKKKIQKHTSLSAFLLNKINKYKQLYKDRAPRSFPKEFQKEKRQEIKIKKWEYKEIKLPAEKTGGAIFSFTKNFTKKIAAALKNSREKLLKARSKTKKFKIPEFEVIKKQPRFNATEFFNNKISKIKEKYLNIEIAAGKINAYISKFVNQIIPKKSVKKLIEKYLSEGFPEDQIKSKLIAVGYDEDLINSILNIINKRTEEEIAKRKKGELKVKIIPKSEKLDESKNKKTKEEKHVLGTRSKDLFMLAFRIFKVKPIRTILTILGIGVSFGVILFLVSLGYGLQRHLLQQISSSESLLNLDVYSPKPEILAINNETIKNFSLIPNVHKVSPIAVVPGQISLNNVSFEVSFTGVSENFNENGGLNLTSGNFFSEKAAEAVISSFFLKLLNKRPEEIIGNEMSLAFFIPSASATNEVSQNTMVFKEEKRYKVTGIIEDDSNNFIYIPFPVLEKFNLPSYGSAKIKVADSKDLEGVRSEILELGFTVSSISDTIEQANKIFKALQVILALFGIAALIVAVIGMINTMTIALLERIQEIGIMKVIGASDKDVERLFLLESLIIGFLGGISGLTLGVLSSQLFNLGINILAKTLGGTGINLFYYPLWFVVSIIIFASVVGVLTGTIPARRAGRMDPLQALRYK